MLAKGRSGRQMGQERREDDGGGWGSNAEVEMVCAVSSIVLF
jgi:hypothetical protein